MKTNRIVIDTNVIVGALIFSKSTTMQALREAKQKGLILISVEILSELIDVLSRQKFDRYLSREIRQDFLARETELITINETIDICRDPRDNKFLELAISGSSKLWMMRNDKVFGGLRKRRKSAHCG